MLGEKQKPMEESGVQQNDMMSRSLALRERQNKKTFQFYYIFRGTKSTHAFYTFKLIVP